MTTSATGSIPLPRAGAFTPTTGQHNISEADYHSDPCRAHGGSLSSTVARALLGPGCPALVRYALDHPVTKKCYDRGTVVHGLVLGTGQDIVRVDGAATWRTEAAKAAAAEARAAGAVPLLAAEFDEAQAIAAAVRAEPAARALLDRAGQAERTLLWQEDGTWCRARPDWLTDMGNCPVIVDLKTTSKPVDDATIAKTVWEYGYHCQADWYTRGYYAVHGVVPDFVFILVSTVAPYLVRVISLADEWAEDALHRNNDALRVWRRCVESGEWPGYPNDLQPIMPPRYANLRSY